MSVKVRHRCELVGWALFTLSALFYIISSLRSGDTSSLLGGVSFLAACFFFLAPLLRQARSTAEEGGASPS